MKTILNGGPFDGKEVEVEGKESPFLFCGYQGDGWVRVYKRNQEGKYFHLETVASQQFEEKIDAYS